MKRTVSRKRLNKLTKIWGFQPVARAIMVVSAVAVLATGVTYAALQSQTATLTGNSISTSTADLRIGTTSSTFAATHAGFSFANIIPGAVPAATDGSSFYLKNYSAGPMTLKVSIGTVPVTASNVDYSKVYFNLTRVDTTSTQKFSVADLMNANTTGGLPLTDTLAGVTVAQYKTQVSMDADAFSGTSATITGIDLVFSGAIASASAAN